jgi:hypothetical protein
MYVNVAGAAFLLLTYAALGNVGDDLGETRLRIALSPFYANANDLALALLLASTCLLFLFQRPGIVRLLAGSAGILLCTLYLFKTRSRGGLLAAALLLGALFLLSRTKPGFRLGSLPIIILVLVVSPTDTSHRLSLLLI